MTENRGDTQNRQYGAATAPLPISTAARCTGVPSGALGWTPPRTGPSSLTRLAGSHVLLYVLMFAVPLVGWGMLSAAGYPIVVYGTLELPHILPQSDMLFASLRTAHTVLALVLFATFLAHLAAALTHALVFRDGVFESMASVSVGKSEPSGSTKRLK